MTEILVGGHSTAQHAFITDRDHKFVLLQAGWGYGKSYAGCLKLLLNHAVNDQSWSAIIAPDHAHIGKVIIRTLQKVCKKLNWAFTTRGGTTDMPFMHSIVLGRPILLLSAEAPEKVAGFEVGSILVDEAARIREHDDPVRNIWLQIPGRLRCAKAKITQCILATTGEGTNSWVYKNIIKNPLPSSAYYIGKTNENPYLKAEDIQTMMASIPSVLREAYLNGQTVDFTDKPAHPDFSDENIKELPVQESWHFHLGADFNVDGMSWCLGQRLNTTGEIGLYVSDEHIIEKDARIDKMVQSCHEKGWATKRHIVLHPDRSAKNRSTVGDPQFKVMWNSMRELQWEISGTSDGANPEVKSRIDLVNRMILSADGTRCLFVHPRCVNLIKLLKTAPRAEDGSYAKKILDPHMLDALGYICWDLFKPTMGSINWISGRPGGSGRRV